MSGDPFRRRLGIASLAVIGALVVAPLDAHGQVFKLALTGEPSPGGHGPFYILGAPFVAHDGRVTFWASTDGAQGSCLFRYDANGTHGEGLLCRGEPVGEPDTGDWRQFIGTHANRANDVVFVGQYFDGSGLLQKSVFRLDEDGTLTRLADEGDLAPGPTGNGVITSVVLTRVNDARNVIFASGHNIFHAPVGGPVVAVLPASLPDDATKYFTLIERIALSQDGAIAFDSIWEDVTFPEPSPEGTAAYLYDAGSYTRLAIEGQPVGSAVPGTYVQALTLEFSPEGTLFGILEMAGAPISQVLVRWNGTEWEPVVTPAAGVTAFSLHGVGEGDAVLYQERTSVPTWTTFLLRDGATTQIVTTGDAAPGTAGGVFKALAPQGPYHGAGPVGPVIGASSSLDGGSATNGVFVFGALPATPSLGPAGGVAAVLLLVVIFAMRSASRSASRTNAA